MCAQVKIYSQLFVFLFACFVWGYSHVDGPDDHHKHRHGDEHGVDELSRNVEDQQHQVAHAETLDVALRNTCRNTSIYVTYKLPPIVLSVSLEKIQLFKRGCTRPVFFIKRNMGNTTFNFIKYFNVSIKMMFSFCL